MERVMTFEEFKATGKLMHFDELSTDMQEGWANDYEGCEVIVYEGGPALGKDGDEYFFDDYKERFSGPKAEMEKKYYDFLAENDSLPLAR